MRAVSIGDRSLARSVLQHMSDERVDGVKGVEADDEAGWFVVTDVASTI